MATRIKRTPAQYKFDSLDFDVQILSKHFTPLADRDIRFVVIHHMTIVGKGTGSALDACYSTWQNRQASAHYGVDGKLIRQFVWDKDFAWATASNIGNLYGISIENANSSGAPSWGIGSDTWHTTAKLTAYLHKVYKLGRPTSSGFGKGGTIRTHQSFFATACPGPYFQKIWSQFVAEVQRIYDEIIKGKTPTVPSTPISNAHVVKGGDTLWAISRKYNVTVDDLVKWNNLEKPYIIYPGQTIHLKGTSTPKPPVTPSNKAVWGKPETWKIGATGSDVTRLGQRIALWSKALGLPSPYKVGPGSPLGEADVRGLSAIQKKWWPTASTAKGGDADGYPGPETFRRLAADPPASKSISTVADEVIAGKWGNGSDRVKRLKAAGYNPNLVQAEVNRKLR